MMFIGTETLVTQLENERSRVDQECMQPKCVQPDKIYVHYIERHYRNMVHPSNGCVSLSFDQDVDRRLPLLFLTIEAVDRRL